QLPAVCIHNLIQILKTVLRSPAKRACQTAGRRSRCVADHDRTIGRNALARAATAQVAELLHTGRGPTESLWASVLPIGGVRCADDGGPIRRCRCCPCLTASQRPEILLDAGYPSKSARKKCVCVIGDSDNHRPIAGDRCALALNFVRQRCQEFKYTRSGESKRVRYEIRLRSSLRQHRFSRNHRTVRRHAECAGEAKVRTVRGDWCPDVLCAGGGRPNKGAPKREIRNAFADDLRAVGIDSVRLNFSGAIVNRPHILRARSSCPAESPCAATECLALRIVGWKKILAQDHRAMGGNAGRVCVVAKWRGDYLDSSAPAATAAVRIKHDVC